VQSPEDEDIYIQYFRENEEIQLDKEAIQKNFAKGGLAKLCLNCFCRKLTKSNNRPKTKMIADPHKLIQYLATHRIEVTSLLFSGD
jgi:hypothetical protein